MSELSHESRAILETAGEPPGPSAGARSRMKGALALQAATVLGTSAVAGTAAGTVAASAAGTGMAVVKGVVAILLVSGAAAGTVWGVRSVDRTAKRNHAAAVSNAAEPVPSLPAPFARDLGLPTSVTATAEEPVIVAPSRVPEGPSVAPVHRARSLGSPQSAPTQASATAAAAPTPTTLAEELGEIHAAQAALQRGDAQVALGALDRHEARFPAGTLSEERRSLRVTALCTLGRRAEARAEAARLLAENPRSPQAGRVRASCAGDNR